MLFKCVGRGVNGKNDVYGTLGLGQRVEGQVLQVFAAVDKGENFGGGDFAAGRIDVAEGVGVGGNVV